MCVMYMVFVQVSVVGECVHMSVVCVYEQDFSVCM